MCDVCGGPVTARDRRGERMYVRRDRYCVAILADDLDEVAEAVILAFLRRSANMRAIRRAPEESWPPLTLSCSPRVPSWPAYATRAGQAG
jgi:hypothetical protein